MKFNINDYVKVRLTRHGKSLLGDRKYPKPDEEGYYEFQMHDLMVTFWKTGSLAPFIDNEIVFDDKYLEELPESQEEGFEDDGCICAEYDGKGKSTCGIPCPVHFKPQKEECKHENMSAWACRGCGMTCAEAAKDWSKRLQEGVKTALNPQPKQKPSAWISKRSIELYEISKGRDAIQARWETCDKKALLDFLDSHADLFNK